MQVEWDRMLHSTLPMLPEALALIDEGKSTVIAKLPALEKPPRGKENWVRFSEKSVNIALGLKLLQLHGNIYAGRLLVENRLFFEWEVIQRSVQDAIEDVNFLVFCEHDETVIVQRYLRAFFDDDFDKDGQLANRKNLRIERREVRDALVNVLGERYDKHPLEGFKASSQILHRVRSGSVHGRAASITRAYLGDVKPNQDRLSLGGNHATWRTNLEYLTWLQAVLMTVSVFIVAGYDRWWDEEFVNRASNLNARMRKSLQVSNHK